MYGPEVTKVEYSETPNAYIFLAGPRAFKLMKAKPSSIFDLSTIAARQAACLMELSRSRPMAPTLYRGVVRVVRDDDGHLVLGGDGTVVDWLIAMNRFDQNALFDRRYKSDSSDHEGMMQLADIVAYFHVTAPRDYTYGGMAGIREEIERYVSGTAIPDLDQPDAMWEALRQKISQALDKNAELLDARRAKGLVRQCHGDLHLGSICLFEDRPTPFGAAGMSDMLFRIDILYDIARLLADMISRRLYRQSNYFFNHYMDACGGHDGVSVMPLFLAVQSIRHAVILRESIPYLGHEKKKTETWRRISTLVKQAGNYFIPSKPCLVALGGLSGSGKTHLAREIAPFLGRAPGAVILRTDVMRKRILGIDLDENLDADGYTPSMSGRAYGDLYSVASSILRSGYSVVVDAVCASPEQRQVLENVASSEGAAFWGFWLQAPAELLMKRARKHKDSGWEAMDILRLQLSRDTGEIRWTRLDTSFSKEETVRRAYGALDALQVLHLPEVGEKQKQTRRACHS